ncbi:MAG: phosphate ABC transporter permease subunit PstC [Proteobacteria bacterium]|nr:phosphate ABC transporter permease subunit PstC [Pseudomonadota bacterium]
MKTTESIVKNVFFISALTSALITISIFCFMVILGLPIFREGLFLDMLTQPWLPQKSIYGIFPMILGTLFISFLSVFIAFPICMGCAALISVIHPGRFSRFLKGLISLMTGIPTVIYGFIGIFLLVPFIREIFEKGSGMCILSAAILLAVLISPTMILFFSSTFENIPESYLKAIDALGGTKVQKLLYVILPNSLHGIITGFTLSLGRAIGDTMIALMVAGNAIAVPTSVIDSSRTLTAHIALLIAADFNSMEFKTLFLCGMILYLLTLACTVLVKTLSAGKRNA